MTKKKIRQEIDKIKGKTLDNDLALEKAVENSSSEIVSAFAAAQLDYNKKIEDILIESSIGSEETMALCAEYAVDFACQTISYALLAVLCAIDGQLRGEKNNEK